MSELGTARGAEAALGDRLGLQELADFVVVGGWRAGLVVAEELPLGKVVKLQLGFEPGEVGQGGALEQKTVFAELSACFLHADFERLAWFGIERHRLAVDHVVLPHPTLVRTADFDLDTSVLLTPSPNESFYIVKSLDVFVVRSVLTDFKSAVGLHQDFGQAGKAVQKEPVSDEHQIAFGPMLAREQQVLDGIWIQQWLAAEEGEAFGTQTVGPTRIVCIGLLDARHCAGEVVVRVMAALLAREVATVCEMVFQCRQFDHRLVALITKVTWRTHWWIGDP